MLELNPPLIANPDDERLKIFLAGSIENGAAEKWQDRLIADIRHKELDVLVFNPRNKNWDSSLKQSASNEKFRNQVNWELNGIESADIVVFYFDPNTKSPISLLELGLVSGVNDADLRFQDVLVCCPDGFWRKGNVEIMCERFNFPLYNDYNSFLAAIIKTIQDF
jgi:hypothetical protein